MLADKPDRLLGGDFRFTAPTAGYESLLSREALAFLMLLQRQFGTRIDELLVARQQRQARIDAGIFPDFLDSTRVQRGSEWHVGAIPDDLQDRRVEITGPVDRKMVINGLNSGAKVFMADFEDATSPTWSNLLDGQLNLIDAVRRTIAYDTPEGKHYELTRRPRP